MREKNVENLEELFERFVDSGEAKEAAQDIIAGDRIFVENPAPAPDAALVSQIKASMSTPVEADRAVTFRRRVYRVAAVAAAFLIFASLSVRIYEPSTPPRSRVTYASTIPRAIWEGHDIVADDADLATIAAAIDQIEGELLALEDGEAGIDTYDELLELESELLEIESNFWKG